MTGAEIKRRYEAGEHLRQIAGRAGLSHETVRQRLIALGVALRPRSSVRRKPAMTASAEEVLADLSKWPGGVGVEELSDWIGDSRTTLSNAIRTLFARGLITVRAA